MGNCNVSSSSGDKPSQHQCSVCGNTAEKLFRCATCKAGLYCGRKCQEKDWAEHVKKCSFQEGKSPSKGEEKKGEEKSPAGDSEVKKPPQPGAKTNRSFQIHLSLLDVNGLKKGGEHKGVLVFEIDGRRRCTPKLEFKNKNGWKNYFGFVFEATHRPKTFTVSLLTPTEFDELKATSTLTSDGEISLAKPFASLYPTILDETEERQKLLETTLKLKEGRGEIKLVLESRFPTDTIGQIQGKEVVDPVSLLEVKVVGGHHLKSLDLLSFSDPFVMVSLGERTFRSKTKLNQKNPVWNFSCPIWILKESPDRVLKISCYDDDITSHKLIGSCFVDIKTIKESKEYTGVIFQLHEVDPKTDADWSGLEAKRDKSKKLIKDLEEGGDEKVETSSLEVNFHLLPYEKVESDFYGGMLDMYDNDKNGGISYPELLHMLQVIGSKKTPEEVKEIFEKSDKNGDGLIDKEELIKLFRSHTLLEKELNKIVQTAMTKKDPHFSLLTQGYLSPHAKKVDTSAESKDISVRQRKTGLVIKESIPTYVTAAMKVFYRTVKGRETVESGAIQKLLKAVSVKQGAKMDSEKSQKNILSFIKLHNLNVTEIEKPYTEYKTMNEFFYRKLKPGARVAHEPDNAGVAVSPADSRLMAFETVADSKRLWIKGKQFDIPSLLGGWGEKDDRASEFKNCSLAIARLAPQDYHRWHFPVTGIVQERFPIDGEYNTVNPIAVRQEVDVFTANKRCVCPIETKEFGTVVLVAIAAAMVGSIRFECDCKDLKDGQPCCETGKCYIGRKVQKFDLHGYFAFGGSTVIVLFKEGKIKFDSDLLTNSGESLETYIKVGESIGTAT